MAEADILQRRLIEAQNPDGGWGYQNGSSWTEPTAFALLALQARNISGEEHDRGCLWLRKHQRPDGGWPPNPNVPVSTCVTSLAALALSRIAVVADCHHRAIQWLVSQIEPEMHAIAKVVFRMRGVTPPVQIGGSSWFPGTAPWIAPTATAVLALSEASTKDPRLLSHVRDGQQFILSRRCRDGGWNHGGVPFAGENALSYPETTGMALLALRGVAPSELALPIKVAESHFLASGSLEGQSWLQLALLVHGRAPQDRTTGFPCRSARDSSLRLLALAGNNGVNKLLGPV